jgi:hypothetical protein
MTISGFDEGGFVVQFPEVVSLSLSLPQLPDKLWIPPCLVLKGYWVYTRKIKHPGAKI